LGKEGEEGEEGEEGAKGEEGEEGAEGAEGEEICYLGRHGLQMSHACRMVSPSISRSAALSREKAWGWGQRRYGKSKGWDRGG
jgi:hypothetical protein